MSHPKIRDDSCLFWCQGLVHLAIQLFRYPHLVQHKEVAILDVINSPANSILATILLGIDDIT
jgi:hypothetical protein